MFAQHPHHFPDLASSNFYIKHTIKVKEVNLANFMLFTAMVQERHDNSSRSNQKHRNMEDFTPQSSGRC